MSTRSSGSLGQYNMHRAMSTVVRSVLITVVCGAFLSMIAEPKYRCTAKLFLEPGSTQQAILDTNNPLSALFSSPAATLADQIEIMKGDAVTSEAYRDADVPPDSVAMSINQIPGTHVVELVVDSATATYAERMAKVLPNACDGYITGNRRTEIANAYSYAKSRLNEENEKLVEAEIAQETFASRVGKPVPFTPYARKMQEMQRDIDLHRGTVDTLIKSVEDLRVREKMTHDPIMVISPARQAKQISPSKTQYLFNSVIVGLVLGLFAAGIQVLLRTPRGA